MRQLFFAKKLVRIVDTKFCGIQNDQDLGDQRLHDWLAGLAADQPGDLVATLAQKLLESAHHSDPFAYRHCLPRRLCLLCAEHRILNIARAGTSQLSQHLSGCRIRGYDCAVPYGCRLSSHV